MVYWGGNVCMVGEKMEMMRRSGVEWSLDENGSIAVSVRELGQHWYWIMVVRVSVLEF